MKLIFIFRDLLRQASILCLKSALRCRESCSKRFTTTAWKLYELCRRHPL